MRKRAFIIAIERYAQMQEGLNTTLPDTHKHALEFRDWLTGTQGLAPEDICFCAEDAALPGRTSDATRAAIKRELKRFKDVAKDATEDLYFYFSGHGFCYLNIDEVPSADVILAADYVKRDESGDACFKLDEIQKWLKMCLGSVTAGNGRCGHYYFIDACRNMVSEREIVVAPLGYPYEISVRKKAPVYTLYSTTTGAVASAASAFPEALLDGLRGKGHAKRWYEGTFAVLFDSLRGYVERRLETELEPRTEGGDGVIRKLDPGLEYTCAVTVKNATAQDEFQVQIRNELNQVVQTFTFTGSSRQFKAPPDEYSVQVQLTSAADAVVEPATPQPADLYDDCALTYEKRAAAPGAVDPIHGRLGLPPAPPMASLHLAVPRNAEATIRGGRDRTVTATGQSSWDLFPGTYSVELRDARGVTVDRRELMLEAGDQTLDLTKLPDSPLRHALLDAIHGRHEHGSVDFSESLGPTPDHGLDLWLALMGAARIVGAGDDFSKLGPLPLARFETLGAGRTAIYVLAGFDQPDTTFRARITNDWREPPAPLRPHRKFPGLYELVDLPADAGHRYLTVQVGDNVPVTIGVCALPQRGSLVTVSQTAPGHLQIQQFILPLRQFQQQLPQGGGLWRDGADRDLDEMGTPLGLVRRCVEVQRAFARAHDLRSVLTERALDFLLYFKWFEPVVALLAAYELIRRGELQVLPTVVANLRQHFGKLPDTEALARLAGLDWTMPDAPPLVLEGLQALNLMSDATRVPPADAVVFRGPWAMWRGLDRY